MSIGANIRAVRKARGLTQQEVADAAELADSAIRKYESGKIVPTVKTLRRIASALGVPLTVLIDGGPDEDAKLNMAPASRARLEAALQLLNESGLSIAIERIEELAKIPDYQKIDT